MKTHVPGVLTADEYVIFFNLYVYNRESMWFVCMCDSAYTRFTVNTAVYLTTEIEIA